MDGPAPDVQRYFAPGVKFLLWKKWDHELDKYVTCSPVDPDKEVDNRVAVGEDQKGKPMLHRAHHHYKYAPSDVEVKDDGTNLE